MNYTVSFFPYRGDVIFQQSGNLLAMMWHSIDLVTMLSTIAQPGEVKTVDKNRVMASLSTYNAMYQCYHTTLT